ncbi:hypothetical protein FDA94_29090 [Herbidospora galbida]|uniref:Bacteriophage T4 Gp32 single-stranded DNA-binding domain-containing protein n=1 Tax=Herbidospora galbida TaxID=2575442 RepID=A0A4U3M780_9ACTN|nr:hypothetical protein [Herbidospora galbida]TKK84671.1 hypothetical protein FDA94_29090 [Herbidospora galbida]
MTRTIARRERPVNPETREDEEFEDDFAAPTTRRLSVVPDEEDAVEDEIPQRRPSGRATRTNSSNTLLSRHRTDGGGLKAVSEGVGNSGGRDFDAERITLGPEEQVIAFLESDCFVAFRQHFLQEKEGRKSYVCLTAEDECPLCAYEESKPLPEGRKYHPRPAFKAFFNVALLTPGGEPEVKRLEIGQKLFDIILSWSEQSRTSPINKNRDGVPVLYWAVSRHVKKVGGRDDYTFNLSPVSRDALADFDDEQVYEEITAEQYAELLENLYDESCVTVDDHDTLQEIVDELTSPRARRRAA